MIMSSSEGCKNVSGDIFETSNCVNDERMMMMMI